MPNDSTQLADWLSKILVEDNAAQGGEDTERDIWHFPTDEVREEYISTIDSRDEAEVRRVIERMLLPRGASGFDLIDFQIYQRAKAKEGDDEAATLVDSFEESGRMRRVIDWFTGSTDEPPWPGIK